MEKKSRKTVYFCTTFKTIKVIVTVQPDGCAVVSKNRFAKIMENFRVCKGAYGICKSFMVIYREKELLKYVGGGQLFIEF